MNDRASSQCHSARALPQYASWLATYFTSALCRRACRLDAQLRRCERRAPTPAHTATLHVPHRTAPLPVSCGAPARLAFPTHSPCRSLMLCLCQAPRLCRLDRTSCSSGHGLLQQLVSCSLPACQPAMSECLALIVRTAAAAAARC